jgi:hypothetical protein
MKKVVIILFILGLMACERITSTYPIYSARNESEIVGGGGGNFLIWTAFVSEEEYLFTFYKDEEGIKRAKVAMHEIVIIEDGGNEPYGVFTWCQNHSAWEDVILHVPENTIVREFSLK